VTPAQIEGMIDRICGIYATQNVSRNSMKGAWSQDEFLLGIPVERGREVLVLVEAHGKIPSLPEIKQMFHRILRSSGGVAGVTKENCQMCGGSGWHSGVSEGNDDGFREWFEQGGYYARVSRICPCRR
jgi:hypothetical protein